MAVSGLLNAGFVCLVGTEAHQDLIVAKVAGRVEGEILVTVLLGQTHRNLALEDKIKLTKVLLALDDGLVCDKDTTVESRNEEGQELSSSFTNLAGLILIPENVVEVADHWLKELLD